MTILIAVLGGLTSLIGLSVSIWSFLDTRKKYYQEFMDRKHSETQEES